MRFILLVKIPLESKKGEILATGSAGVDMNTNGQDENSIESEEDECVNEYSFAVSLHATEL